MKIVDYDVSWAGISTKSEKKEKEDEGDLAVVAEFIDERPEELKQMEAFQTGNKWKILGEQEPDLSLARRPHHSSQDSSAPRRVHPNRPDLPPGVAPFNSSLGLKKSSRGGDESSQHQNQPSSSPGPGKQLHYSRNFSPSHRKFHSNPTTKKHQRHDVDFLPGKRNQQASDSDLSPPWKKQKEDTASDLSPPRRKQKTRDSNSDFSSRRRCKAPGAKAMQLSSGSKTELASYVKRWQQELRRQDQESKHLKGEFQNAETELVWESGFPVSPFVLGAETRVKMRERDSERFSNPIALDGHAVGDPHSFHQSKLTNEDFRKLLMTPRAATTSAPPFKSRHHEMPRKYNEDEDPAAPRRKKKSYYAKLRQQEIEHERELEEKYRDRAKERRDGVNKDYEETELISTSANYRAVLPTAEADKSAAEKRRQLIQESKFLGGDMEHTHLVKGLDFALLQKVRAEIASKEKEEEEMMKKPQKEIKKDEEDPENKIEFKTRLGRNIYHVLFNNKACERNELFLPGRMAYVVDLDDEYADTDIPTTLIRSKADCPTMEAQTTLTTNDIVISKLTQILSYLRQGTRNKKLKKKDKGKLDEKKPPEADMNIFEDIGDYVPSTTKVPREKEPEQYREWERDRDRERERERERERDRERVQERDPDRDRDREREEEKKQRSYFEKPKVDNKPIDIDKGPGSAKELIKSINEKFAGSAGWEGGESLKKPEEKKQLGDFFGMSNSYAECYPATMDDMAVDSDEEMDYSKMDQGKKKGLLGRWDFDTEEEYSEYMNNKEALPKAAFQYGIKISESRKTRRFKERNDKAELDRQWKKISAIIEKRKKLEADGVEVKRPRF